MGLTKCLSLPPCLPFDVARNTQTHPVPIDWYAALDPVKGIFPYRWMIHGPGHVVSWTVGRVPACLVQRKEAPLSIATDYCSRTGVLAADQPQPGLVSMMDGKISRLAALPATELARIRAAVRQEVDALAWDLISRLSGDGICGAEGKLDSPLDMDAGRS